MLKVLPKAVTSLFVTSTVRSLDNGLLRTTVTCAVPLLSLTLYADSLNLMITTNNRMK